MPFKKTEPINLIEINYNANDKKIGFVGKIWVFWNYVNKLTIKCKHKALHYKIYVTLRKYMAIKI